MDFVRDLINNTGVKVLIIVICLDTILGILRAIREKKINSCIGIDGIIRKVAMLLSITFLALVDSVVNVNLIGFIPEKFTEVIHIKEITINGLFNILFIVFEFLSVLKNMTLIKLPIPKKAQQWLEEIMNKFTGELDGKGGISNEKRN